MSRPMVVIACMTWLLRIVGALTAPTSMALTCRVEEPSTASIGDLSPCHRTRNAKKRRRLPLRQEIRLKTRRAELLRSAHDIDLARGLLSDRYWQVLTAT